MRLAVTADLHWGLSRAGDAATRDLRDSLMADPPDTLILAGDVGEGRAFAACLAEFRELTCVKLLVPGNHDLWLRAPTSSMRHYQETLPMLAGEAGFSVLDFQPWQSRDGDVSILGSIHWYDYSFADPELRIRYPDANRMYIAKQFPAGRHNDGSYVRLGVSDPEFADSLLKQLQRQSAESSRVGRRILVTHHPPVRELFYPTELVTDDQKFWLAYTGTRAMDAWVRQDARFDYVFCGHTHAACEARIGPTTCLNVGGDYHFKRLIRLDLSSDTANQQEFRVAT